MASGANTNLVAGAGSGAASGAAMGFMVGGPMGAGIGAGVGGLAGLAGGLGQNAADKAQAKAIKQARIAQEKEVGRQAKGVAAARTRFGDLWSMGAGVADPSLRGEVSGISADPTTYQKIAPTLTSYSHLAGGVEADANATRDAGALTGADVLQRAVVGNRASLASRGLMGSSIAGAQGQALAGQFAQGKADLAAQVQAVRDAGFTSAKEQQLGFEGMALGGSNISGQLAATKAAGSIAGARGQQPYAAFGNLLNTGIGLLDSAARSEAEGGRGVSALGLPKLGVARSTKPGAVGATTSRGGV